MIISEDLRRWFKEKWTAQDGSECGSYKGRGRVKCRPSRRVSEKSPQTWGEMSKEEKKKAVRKKQEAHRKGKQFSSHKTGKIWDGKKNKYRPRGIREMYEHIKQMFIERKLNKKSDCGCELNEAKKEKKPYKGFKKGKNHPEGGLSRAEARRQGIHAGIETKEEAKRKGGFNKLSGKTQKRRKSFCARMCGMKRRRTSSKTANDPKSKINAALRVWGCRCGTNESYEPTTNMLMEENKPTNPKLWARAKALARKKFDVYPSAYANGWAAKWYKSKGGGWRKGGKKQVTENIMNPFIQSHKEWLKNQAMRQAEFRGAAEIEAQHRAIAQQNAQDHAEAEETQRQEKLGEEVVNKENKGTMTKDEISRRDKRAKSLKGNVKQIKGDTPEEAAHRVATYVELLKRRKKGEKKTKRKKKKG